MLQVFEGLVRMLKLRGDLSRSERRRLRALGMKVFLASYTHLPPPPGTTPEAKATAAAARRRKAVDPRLCRTARIEAAGVAMLAAVFPCEPDVWASIWAELGQRGSSSQCAVPSWHVCRLTGWLCALLHTAVAWSIADLGSNTQYVLLGGTGYNPLGDDASKQLAASIGKWPHLRSLSVPREYMVGVPGGFAPGA